MLSTTLPSLIALFGTLTPGAAASTRMYGVMPLSAIHSYIARNRYGRLEVITAVVVSIWRVICYRIDRNGRDSAAQQFFFFGETAGKAGVAEDAFAVVFDHAPLARQADVETRQA